MTVQHVMSSHSRMDAWMVDSGATCHIYINRSGLVEYESLKTSLKDMLGDSYKVNAVGCGAMVFTVSYFVGKIGNASCMMYYVCRNCHIICLVCQW